ncbi:uncharacterized protein LOC130623803 [Hydractinia symbiolongicarpus]|uniref:uncharacterized protein LOC130623803 n=1 Tax=Hydractinia symbiolongicarpus TaxID=13093 RepID=UPI00254DA945|nr:uncharacterized protein LOC130623803 [Hydractinia symbiolongicarpus]
MIKMMKVIGLVTVFACLIQASNCKAVRLCENTKTFFQPLANATNYALLSVSKKLQKMYGSGSQCQQRQCRNFVLQDITKLDQIYQKLDVTSSNLKTILKLIEATNIRKDIRGLIRLIESRKMVASKCENGMLKGKSTDGQQLYCCQGEHLYVYLKLSSMLRSLYNIYSSKIIYNV